MPDLIAAAPLGDASRALAEGRVFLAFGIPKSGTTFLQTILNSHPEVSCPSEHQFDFLIKNVAGLLTAYNKVLVEVDRRTARQGATLLTDDDVTVVLHHTILAIINSAGSNKRARFIGANDNAIIRRLPLYGEILPNAKFICLVRDPRDTILSQWHHNLKVEPDFRKRAKDLDHWTDLQSKQWQSWMTEVCRLNEQAPFQKSLLITRYEDLAAGALDSFRAIFGHLGASTDLDLVAKIIEDTSFSRAKRKSPQNAFFRRGTPGAWQAEMTPQQVATVRANARAMMARFDYR